jgi:butyryl-CoA dehydrogenase
MIVNTTRDLGAVAMTDGPEAFLADASLYLEMFGHVLVAWQWLIQAMVAVNKLQADKIKKSEQDFYEGKLQVCKYFYRYELPKATCLSGIITRSSATAMTTKTEHFTA